MKKLIYWWCLLTLSGHSCTHRDREMSYTWATEPITDATLPLLFPQTTKEIQSRVSYIKQDVLDRVQKITTLENSQRTFANTAQSLDEIGKHAQRITEPLQIIRFLSPEKELRDAAHRHILELSIFLQKHVAKNVDLYRAFKDYCDHNAPHETLDREQHYYLKETLSAFERNGLLLPENQLEMVRLLIKELDEQGLDFERAISDDNTRLVFAENELVGVPQPVLETLHRDDKDNFVITLNYPTVFAVLKHAHNENTRKTVLRAFENRAYPANYARLDHIIAKRDLLAHVLKFDSYAAYDLDNQMAKNPKTVLSFIQSLAEKAKQKGTQESQQLLALRLTSETDKVNPWNLAYLKENYRSQNFDLDSKKLAEYFPATHVIEQILDLYSSFLNLRFEKLENIDLWHSSTQILKVYTTKNTFCGYLILDLYPRENKFSHAAASPIVCGIKYNDIHEPAVVVIMANMSPGTKDTPGLLTFDEVKTFFHEFGHAMHALLGATRMCTFSGLNTKTDFVEVPSQMFEEWIYSPEILKQIGKHYQTGESLPDTTIQQLQKLIRFDSGDFVLRQTALSTLSLELFTGAHKNIQQLYKNYMQQARPYIAFDDNSHMPANFGHLVGYDAKYYSYMWARVFALDILATIKAYGATNPAIGEQFAQKVLARGGSAEPIELLRDFLGREPNQQAFFEYYGL